MIISAAKALANYAPIVTNMEVSYVTDNHHLAIIGRAKLSDVTHQQLRLIHVVDPLRWRHTNPDAFAICTATNALLVDWSTLTIVNARKYNFTHPGFYLPYNIHQHKGAHHISKPRVYRKVEAN